MEKGWHAQLSIDVMAQLGTNELGLSQEEAKSRLDNFGLNKLPEEKIDSLFVIFLRQFQSPLIYILMVAGTVIFALGETIDSIIILIVLVFNAVIGTIQEGKANNTLLALKKFSETKATVLRQGEDFIIPDTEVVPGDILILQEGEKISADARIIFSNNLKVDEAAFTGESEPVHKIEEPVLDSSREGGKNMVLKASHIVSGNGKAVVVATGAKTVIGKIADRIKVIDTEIPLKANIRHLSHIIIIATVLISIIFFLLGIATGKSIIEIFKVVVSLAVSIVPEGLPVVVTLILATGVWRMSKQNALVKKMQAVQALGQASVIAVDKTGTITKNELVISKVYVNNTLFEVQGSGYDPKGNILINDRIINFSDHPDILLAGRIAAYCANASVIYSKEEKLWKVSGDPTEAAMSVFAQKIGFHKDILEREHPIVSEMPFDYHLKYHALVYGSKGSNNLIVVGAPEIILALCSQIQKNGIIGPLYSKEREEIDLIFTQMSQEGLRVVAFARAENASENVGKDQVKDLIFTGFYGMKDALRPEVIYATQKAKEANIRVVMITGDHKITATAIAKEAGIFKEGDGILTGAEIDAMSKSELAKKIDFVSIFARANPDHKLLIIKAFQSNGKIIAMTGDGVNDAPSLVAADLGVAMGKIGTEVAKEASDIVLLDDNFGSIVTAVEEGRSIYKTIKKVILYLFSTSLGEVFAIIGALLIGYPLPVLASQIIWLNFVTDGFLTVAIGLEPKEKGLLTEKLQSQSKYLINKPMFIRMVLMALTMAIFTLILFGEKYQEDIIKAQTISLTLLAIFQWFNAWNCRSEDKSIFRMELFTNKPLLGVTAIVIILQIFAVYSPFMNKFLKTTPLELGDWLLMALIATSIIIVDEIRKMYVRNKEILKYHKNDGKIY